MAGKEEVQGNRLVLLMQECFAAVRAWSYLRRYFCGRRLNHQYVEQADSRNELVAPLFGGTESRLGIRERLGRI